MKKKAKGNKNIQARPTLQLTFLFACRTPEYKTHAQLQHEVEMMEHKIKEYGEVYLQEKRNEYKRKLSNPGKDQGIDLTKSAEKHSAQLENQMHYQDRFFLEKGMEIQPGEENAAPLPLDDYFWFDTVHVKESSWSGTNVLAPHKGEYCHLYG